MRYCYNVEKNNVDIDKVKKAIQSYRMKTDENPHYIIMSDKTRERLIEGINTSCVIYANCGPRFHEELFGVPIALCNRIKDYEVELV